MEDTLLETAAQGGVGGDIFLIANDIEFNEGGLSTYSFFQTRRIAAGQEHLS